MAVLGDITQSFGGSSPLWGKGRDLGFAFGNAGRLGDGGAGWNWVRLERGASGFICFDFGGIGFVPQCYRSGAGWGPGAEGWGAGVGDRCGRVAGGNWVRFVGGGSDFICFGFGGIGFVSQTFPQGLEAVELLGGPAILAFGLGLVAQQQGKAVGPQDQAMEAIAQQVVTVLGKSDFDLLAELRVHGHAELSAGVEGFAQAQAEESGFEAGGAEDGLLGEGYALDGEELLGVDGAV